MRDSSFNLAISAFCADLEVTFRCVSRASVADSAESRRRKNIGIFAYRRVRLGEEKKKGEG